MLKNKLYYHATGHTGKGFVNFWPSNLEGIENIYVIDHHSFYKVSMILETLIEQYENSYIVEVVISSYHGKLIEGFIVKELSIAFMHEKYLLDNLQTNKLIKMLPNLTEDKEKQIKLLQEEEKDCLKLTYDLFKESLQLHNQLENIYIKEMNFDKANHEISRLKKQIFQDVKKTGEKGIIYERLFGTKTSTGTTEFIPQLLEDMKKTYYIKGRAGTGKSYLMNEIVEEARTFSLDVEIYRCSFDPASIDMVIIRSLGICLLDSTPPHEYYPLHTDDEIVDLYEIAFEEDIDTKYEKKILSLEKAYKDKMKEGKNKMKKLQSVIDQLDNI